MRCAITGFIAAWLGSVNDRRELCKHDLSPAQLLPCPLGPPSYVSVPRCRDMRWPKVAGADWGLLGHFGSTGTSLGHGAVGRPLWAAPDPLCLRIMDNTATSWVDPRIFYCCLAFLGYQLGATLCGVSPDVRRMGMGHLCAQPCYRLWPFCLNNIKPSKNKYTGRFWLYSAHCLAALLKHPEVLAELFSIIFDTSITPFILKCFSNPRPPLESNFSLDSGVFP